eukprot:gnl/Dysnectes_brevis/1142_a1275_4080.p1 GENE.gnl/Dysnectes_brevis/1142_a1275_4080~~gnl/Dysnectes_brevis/1142_a1275_4080.p1  ORF type:complete len:239 (+),score=31.94 gnl/Dysnectes_brevis/1142_a1275_4080:89-805(+)
MDSSLCCRDYIRGNCTRQKCRFHHPSPMELVLYSDFYASILKQIGNFDVCRDYLNGRCSRPHCKFFHPPPFLCHQTPQHTSLPIESSQEIQIRYTEAIREIGRLKSFISFLEKQNHVLQREIAATSIPSYQPMWSRDRAHGMERVSRSKSIHSVSFHPAQRPMVDGHMHSPFTTSPGVTQPSGSGAPSLEFEGRTIPKQASSTSLFGSSEMSLPDLHPPPLFSLNLGHHGLDEEPDLE